MPRPIEFDQVEAVDRAILLFWERGYSNTSVRDLLSAMGIKESSFYNVWPSKSHLYLACLDRYIEKYMLPWISAMVTAQDPRQGLDTFFDKLFETQCDPNLPGSCLMSRSLSTEVMEVPMLRDFIHMKWKGFGVILTDFFQKWKDAGIYEEDFDAGVTARLVGLYIQGIQRVVLVTPDLCLLRQDARHFLDSLGV